MTMMLSRRQEEWTPPPTWGRPVATASSRRCSKFDRSWGFICRALADNYRVESSFTRVPCLRATANCRRVDVAAWTTRFPAPTPIALMQAMGKPRHPDQGFP